MTTPQPRPASTQLRAFRVFVIAWCALCIVAGLSLTFALLQVRDGADALDRAGSSLVSAGETLDAFSEAPLIGSSVGDAAETVADGGRDTIAAAARTRVQVVSLSVLVGIAVAVLPSVPLLVLWWTLGSLASRLARLEDRELSR